ncbi:hypothetical protein AGDE_10840 [Angomonas deanei]|uniref:Uncharacterized protein n=1 Tax=Angomonas deanei TaxID=59799 RepID=A0A7G2C780_9TRYP|nr:hypothetical protein AGDE_10840 [Angomonas deanei]CAD2215315.1 hypothetical protein, conserved [Angomonas deanei]|eukprot:EPY27289.1 hypothetical protein AGDE_10840 [Angomonas deanei]
MQQKNTMPQRNLKLKYYDETGWSERRPAASNDFHLKSISICNVDFKNLEVADVESFIVIFCEKTPSIAVVQNIPLPALEKLKGNSIFRKMYALCETMPGEKEDCMAIFLRYGLQCEPNEINLVENDKVSLKALLVQLPINVAGKSMININVVNSDYTVTKSKKAVQLTDALLNQVAGHDNTLVLSNDCEGINFSSDAFKELKQGRDKIGFVDLVSEGLERHVPSSWVMWMKTTKFVPLKDSSFAESIRGPEIQLIMTSVTPRSGGGSIAIPIPRSQKVTQSRSKSPVVANSALTNDPAILSAEATKSAKGDTRPTRPRWKLNHSIPLKSDAPTDHCIDLSRLFPSVEVAVEELNKNLNWPLDVALVHNVVLYSDGISSLDKQSILKKIPREVKPNQRQEIEGALLNYNPIYNAEKMKWVKKSLDTTSAFPRADPIHREWSESCCTIVYQITPREKKYDISQKMGLDKDNLKKAIKFLNHSNSTVNKDENPLHDYPYDYALLFSVERQGYWLIAAKHVPCDIVACRTEISAQS